MGVASRPRTVTEAFGSLEEKVLESDSLMTVYAQPVMSADPRLVPVPETVIVPDSDQPFCRPEALVIV